MKKINFFGKMFLVLGVVAFLVFAGTQLNVSAGPKTPSDKVGRLSPASLDVDTCGCPTTFGDPVCQEKTSWTLEKTAVTTDLLDPIGASFSYTVTVTEGETRNYITGTGQIVITNSGDVTSSLSSVVINLEQYAPGMGDAPGPSGNNWKVLLTALENESATCEGLGIARFCDGKDDFEVAESPGASLVLFDPENNDIIALTDVLQIPPTLDDDGDGLRDEDPVYTGLNDTALSCSIIDNDGDGLFDEDPIAGIDNDGDGLIDEDPIDGIDNDGDGLIDEDDPDDDGDGEVNEDDPDDDGDGLIDEDGACENSIIINFSYEFDITDLGLMPGDGIVPSDDDLRIDLMATFAAGGSRGATCAVDIDCNGDIEGNENFVRTIQQRHQFDPPECDPVCDSVTLEDTGAYVVDDPALPSDPNCVEITSNTLSEVIYATGVEGTVSSFEITGTVTCDCVSPDPPLEILEDEIDNVNATMSPNFSVTYPYGGAPSYFQIDLAGTGTPPDGFDGHYLGWCVDTDNVIYAYPTVYGATLVSTYADEAYLGLFVEKPWNLDLVNWIINQGFVGTPSAGYGNFTYGDVQRAIWALIEDNQSTSGLGSWNQNRVDQILAAAYASGEDFVPMCGEQVGIFLVPDTTTAQAVMGQVTMSDVILDCLVPDPCVGCTAVITNEATLTCDDNSLIEGSPASDSFTVTCSGMYPDPFPPIVPGDFCTQTQGGWGQDACNGNNTGCLRDAYFDTLFPTGLIVGDPDGPDGDGLKAILLTSSAAVAEYLENGNHGTPGRLTQDLTDPGEGQSSSGNLGTQLVAATLNVAFDAAGIGKCTLTSTCDFAYPPGTLGSLVYVDCVDEDLIGLTVNQVLNLANTAISGGVIPSVITYSDLNEALTALNEEYVDCETVTGCLELP